MSKQKIPDNARFEWCILTYDDMQTYELQCNLAYKIKRTKIVDKYVYITHDDDHWTKEDLDEHYPIDPETGLRPMNKETGKPFEVGDHKKTHAHVYIHLKVKKRKKWIASQLGIPEWMLQPLGDKQKFLNYLTHRLDPQKTQYDDSKASSNFNWIKERDGFEDAKEKEIDQILHMVEDGILTRNNYSKLLSITQYEKYKDKLNKAWEYYDHKHRHDKIYRTNIYIQPDYNFYDEGQGSGSGKTTLALEFSKAICDMMNWDYGYMGKGNDTMGSYNAEEVAIFDDKSFETFNRDEFLNMFDPYAHGAMPSRFKDKEPKWRVALVTSIYDFSEQMSKIKGLSNNEDVTQLKRRFQYIWKVTTTTIAIYRYDDITKSHVFQEELRNNILQNILDLEKHNRLQEQQDITIVETLKLINASHGESMKQRNTVAIEDVAATLKDLSIEDKRRLIELMNEDIIDAEYTIKEE